MMSMVGNGKCVWEVAGIALELSAKLHQTFEYNKDEAKRLVTLAKETTIDNFLGFHDKFQDYLKAIPSDLRKENSEFWNTILSENKDGLMQKLFEKEHEWAGNTEMGLCLANTTTEMVIIHADEITATTPLNEALKAVHPVQLQGVVEESTKTDRVFSVLLRGHYYLGGVKQRAIFKSGEDADEALSQLLEFIKNRASQPEPKPSTPKLMPKPPAKKLTASIVVLDDDGDEGVSGKKKQCWNFRDHGKCRFGDQCNYAHTETMMDIQRREKKAKEKAAQDAAALLKVSNKDGKKGAASKKQAAVQLQSPSSFRLQSGKKVDKATAVEGQGDAQPPPARKSKSSQMCKYYESGGCWKGNNCIFRHHDSADGIARRAACTQPTNSEQGGERASPECPPEVEPG